jgi:predicted DNA binding CopG/RHH family protein
MKEIKIKSIKNAELTPMEEAEFDKIIEQADKDVEKLKKSVNVNFRWNASEIERIKKIAEKKGLPYQTYIKSVLKQAMDKDEVA